MMISYNDATVIKPLTVDNKKQRNEQNIITKQQKGTFLLQVLLPVF